MLAPGFARDGLYKGESIFNENKKNRSFDKNIQSNHDLFIQEELKVNTFGLQRSASLVGCGFTC